MALTSVLVYLGDDRGSAARLAVAFQLAQAHGAHLTALYVIPRPSDFAVPPAVEVAAPELVETYRATTREDAKKVEAAFRSRADRDGLHGEWRCEEGRAGELLALHSRYADLAVLGQSSSDEAEFPPLTRVSEQVVLAAGRPVLVVPYIGSRSSLGSRILVAWNGSREAARAVNDALPILEKAEHVVVLVVDPKGAGRVPGADISTHLARHGVHAEAAQTPSGEIAVGDVLLSRAADLGADLIVMGAYGHARALELVMGGATRHVLKHMTVPVLMAH